MGFTIENDVLLKYEEETDVEDVIIPDGVKEIGSHAFASKDAFSCRSHIRKVIIPESVTKIGEEAFYCCMTLQSVHLPEGITEILPRTFKSCHSLQEVNIPAGVRKIGERAFCGCITLENVALPEGLVEIGSEAFADCGMKHLTIPASVETVGLRPCDAQEAFIVDPGNPNYASMDGVLYDRQCKTLLRCPRKKEKIIVPEGVTEIGELAFFCCKMTVVILPESLEKIGERAFYNCLHLTEMTVPAGVKELGRGAFGICEALREIHLPERMEQIGDRAFSHCQKLERLTIPAGIKEIEECTFFCCESLREVHLPEGLESIGATVFKFCEKLRELTLPASVTELDPKAFLGCEGLEVVHVAEGNLCFVEEDGVLYRRDNREILFFPTGQEHVILNDKASACPAEFMVEKLREVEYKGYTFYGYGQSMFELLKLLVNKDFSPDFNGEYRTLWGMYLVEPDYRQRICEKMQPQLGEMCRWLLGVKNGQEVVKILLASEWLDFREVIDDLIVCCKEQELREMQFLLMDHKRKYSGSGKWEELPL